MHTPLGLKKWVEVGNSGVFRPEMLLPMGLPPEVSVIAWGLSLERLVLRWILLTLVGSGCWHSAVTRNCALEIMLIKAMAGEQPPN